MALNPFIDNIETSAPKVLDNKNGRFSGGIWRPYDTINEYELAYPILASRAWTQQIFVLNPNDNTLADLYVLNKSKAPVLLVGGTDISAIKASITTLTDAIQDESLSRQAADEVLSEDLDNETDARIAGDLVNANAIIAETDRATAAEEVNSNAIAAETTRAIAVENTKANASDIQSNVNITFSDLVANTYTNTDFSDQTVDILYKNPTTTEYDSITFDEDGVATMPVTAVSGFEATLLGVAGVLNSFYDKAFINLNVLGIVDIETTNIPLIPTIYNKITGGLEPASPIENPIQEIENEKLKITWKHGASDIALLDTSHEISSIEEYSVIKFSAKAGFITGGPSYGIVIGDASTKDWSCILYRDTGAVYNISSAGDPLVLRNVDSNYDFVSGDVIGIEYNITSGEFITSLNGIKSTALTTTPKIGKLYLGSRGNNNCVISEISLTNNVFNNNELILDAQQKASVALLSDKINAIPYKFYNFGSLDITTITTQSPTTVIPSYAKTEDGLRIGFTGSSDPIMFTGNVGIDNSVDFYKASFRSEIVTLGTNPMIGMAFGQFGVNMFAFGYRSNGSLSFNVNGTFTTPRIATPSLSFGVGDEVGMDFEVDKAQSTITIKTVLNGEVDSISYELSCTDFTNIYFYRRTTSTTINTVTIDQFGKDEAELPKTVFYADSLTGSDSNPGNKALPFLTLAKAFQALGTLSGDIILSGQFYEPLPLVLADGQKVVCRNNWFKEATVFGSKKLTPVKTSGYTNVYESAHNTAIPEIRNLAGVSRIFEMGNSSKLILPGEHLPHQRGLTNRLKFVELFNIPFNTNLATTLASLDSSATGGFYYDSVNSKIYFKSSNGSDPLSNGFFYEVPSRPCTTIPVSFTNSSLTLIGVNFYFSNGQGASFRNIANIKRIKCGVFGSVDDGFIDDECTGYTYLDECGSCGNDGTNGHMSAVTGYQTLDPRQGCAPMHYESQWSHDNYGDGNSHHELGQVQTTNCLFEYNKKSGIAPSNSCQWVDYNSIIRYNKGVAGRGEGVEVINTSVDLRRGCSFLGFGTQVYGNRIGVGVYSTANNKAVLYGVTSKDNDVADYNADFGIIEAHDSRGVTKLITNGGLIDIVPTTPYLI